jgi:ribosome-binding protein aMBF1 (putative translation factor)
MDTRLYWKLKRIAAGYRQQDIAARIGISSSRYSALERGEAEPKDWEVKAVEEFLPPLSQTMFTRRGKRNSAESNDPTGPAEGGVE